MLHIRRFIGWLLLSCLAALTASGCCAFIRVQQDAPPPTFPTGTPVAVVAANSPTVVPPTVAATLPATMVPTIEPTVTPTLPATTTPTVAPTATPTRPVPTATHTTTPASTTRVYDAAPYAGWQTYENSAFGFSLRYPRDYILSIPKPPSTLVDHAIWLTAPGSPEAVLTVAYKRADDDRMVGRTGLGAGDLEPGGEVLLLGEPVGKTLLVFEKRTMTVLYDKPYPVVRDDLVFNIALDCRCGWEGTESLSDATVRIADQIVASITRLD